MNKGTCEIKEKIRGWFPVICLIIYDIVAITVAYFVALWLRFDCRYSGIPSAYIDKYLDEIIIYVLVCLVINTIFKLYKSIWRFAGTSEFLRMVLACSIAEMLYVLVNLHMEVRMPASYYVFGCLLQFSLMIAARFFVRFVLLVRTKVRFTDKQINVMIIGAGNAGRMVIKDINRNPENGYAVKCIIDDDPAKWGKYVSGILVKGGRESILESAREFDIDQIMIAISNIKVNDKRDLLDICNETECELKILPAMSELVNGQVSAAQMKNVRVEDLLGRDTIRVDMNRIAEYVSGKIVMVTGGGGSIGSELCRQIAARNPKHLIIFDVYENNIYDIEQELRRRYPEMTMTALIGSVRDSRRIFGIFEKYKPEIVYHAAAHKHVPLMEVSPCEAIKNNAIGTYKTAFAAMAHGCERFVLISTDKAVNPTNIMGASKRLCEMIVQAFDALVKKNRADEVVQLFTHETHDDVNSERVKELLKKTKTEFVAVRFGNVLGSNGSVIPVFKRQIEEGGPVTVTHKEIIRYFMTIPEAVSLVMEAGAIAKGGEIFVLDMGEPVKIDTLARNLIRLSGYTPDVDIKIEYTGLRPGEKLYEEKLMEEEGLRKTDNDLIHIGNPIPFEEDEFIRQLDELMEAAYKNKADEIREMVEKVVKTYHPV